MFDITGSHSLLIENKTTLFTYLRYIIVCPCHNRLTPSEYQILLNGLETCLKYVHLRRKVPNEFLQIENINFFDKWIFGFQETLFSIFHYSLFIFVNIYRVPMLFHLEGHFVFFLQFDLFSTLVAKILESQSDTKHRINLLWP